MFIERLQLNNRLLYIYWKKACYIFSVLCLLKVGMLHVKFLSIWWNVAWKKKCAYLLIKIWPIIRCIAIFLLKFSLLHIKLLSICRTLANLQWNVYLFVESYPSLNLMIMYLFTFSLKTLAIIFLFRVGLLLNIWLSIYGCMHH